MGVVKVGMATTVSGVCLQRHSLRSNTSAMLRASCLTLEINEFRCYD